MEDFGVQLLESGEPAPGRRVRRTRIVVAAALAPAIAVVIAVVLLSGGGHPPAGNTRPSQPPAVSAGPEQPSHPTTVVNRASTAAAGAGSVLYHATTRIEVRGRRVSSLDETGAIDFGEHSYRATVRNPGSATTIDRISTNGTFYAREGVDGRGPAGRWTAITLPQKALADSTAPVGSQALTDPPALLEAIGTATDQPRVAGAAVIDGVQTTAYRVTAPLAYFFLVTPLPPAVTRRQVDITVWVDQAGRPRRAVATFDDPSSHVRLATQTHFYGYGTPVDVTAPSAEVDHAPAGVAVPDPLSPGLLALLLPGVPAASPVPGVPAAGPTEQAPPGG
jgi:hypothetical protein